MLNCPKCTHTTNYPSNNPITCVDEIRSVTFQKDLKGRVIQKENRRPFFIERKRRMPSIHTG
jgi:hypothetical protein